jgi:hypothetical protein
MTINDCIRLLKSNVTNKYAQAYLKTLPDAIDQGGTSGLCIQLSYILDNAKEWKGTEARQVKMIIRKWIKEKKNETRT